MNVAPWNLDGWTGGRVDGWTKCVSIKFHQRRCSPSMSMSLMSSIKMCVTDIDK